MVDRANIVSRVRTSDGAGGSLYTETTQSNIPCWRQPSMAGEAEKTFGGQLQSGLQWLFVFPHDTTISNDDEIVYGTERFAVMGVMGSRSLELARRVVAVEK